MEGRLLLEHDPPGELNDTPPFIPWVSRRFGPTRRSYPSGPRKVASFIDPSAGIANGRHVIVGNKTFIGPYARLNAHLRLHQDRHRDRTSSTAPPCTSNPTRARNPTTTILIGNLVSVGFGATVIGPSQIGSLGAQAKPTGVGANALIDSATIEPGALVGPLARVGPGVTVPSGLYVLPGSNVTTNAEASDPALGKVAPITATQFNEPDQAPHEQHDAGCGLCQPLPGGLGHRQHEYLRPGHARGLQRQPLRRRRGEQRAWLGRRPDVPRSPGAATARPDLRLPGHRVTGAVVFHQRASLVENRLGIGNSIRADQGQPFIFGSTFTSGDYVVINSPLGTNAAGSGSGITIYDGVQAGDRSVILGGPGSNVSLGGNVLIGPGAVLDRTTVGAELRRSGPRASSPTRRSPTTRTSPPGRIIINNQHVGSIQW